MQRIERICICYNVATYASVLFVCPDEGLYLKFCVQTKYGNRHGIVYRPTSSMILATSRLLKTSKWCWAFIQIPYV